MNNNRPPASNFQKSERETGNQVSLALRSASRLAQQSKTLPMMPSQYKTQLHWPRPRLNEQLAEIFTKGAYCMVPIQK